MYFIRKLILMREKLLVKFFGKPSNNFTKLAEKEIFNRAFYLLIFYVNYLVFRENSKVINIDR
jgi:hypothetical protein